MIWEIVSALNGRKPRAVWHAASPDNWVRPELAAIGRIGLGSAGLQHLMPSHCPAGDCVAICREGAEDTEREPALSWFQGPTEPADPLSSLQAATAGQWTPRGSSRKAKENGMPTPSSHLAKTLSFGNPQPPGLSLMARDFDRQVADIQIRVAVLNRYTALGIPITKPVAFDHSLEPMAFMTSFRPG